MAFTDTDEYRELRNEHDQVWTEGKTYVEDAEQIGFKTFENEGKPVPEGHDKLAAFLYLSIAMLTADGKNDVNSVAHTIALALRVSDAL